MKILLDTQVLLWFVSGDPRLSKKAETAILTETHALFYSLVSLWELAVKTSLGKLELAGDWTKTLPEELRVNSVQPLTIQMAHCERLLSLPFHHRDPFDRMLIAQAGAENMALMSSDDQFRHYNLPVIW